MPLLPDVSLHSTLKVIYEVVALPTELLASTNRHLQRRRCALW